MQNWIIQGGIMLMLIAGSSLLAIAVVLERLSIYQRWDQYGHRFINKLYDLVTVHQIQAAEDLCQNHNSPLSRMALAGLKASDRPREEVREALLHAGAKEVPTLEARLGILSTVAYISPLLGLLGTVLGLIQSFQDFQLALKLQQAGPGIMAEGIWKALITTVAGLTVGIICHILFTYLHARKEQLIHELESSSHELLEIFSEPKN
jgi:biopolymer transport protein ExbB